MAEAARLLEEALTLSDEQRVHLILKLTESLSALDDDARSKVNFGALHVALENAERSDLMAHPRLRALWDEHRRQRCR
jgi:hypothetical protein